MSQDNNERLSKRTKVSTTSTTSTKASSTLDHYVTSDRPAQEAAHITPPLVDRDSTFIAYIYDVTSLHQISSIMKHVKHVVHRDNAASHDVAAWRLMTIVKGQSGMKGPEDWTLQQGSEDDGEKWGGSKILKVMEQEGIVDALVIVSRWFGGTMLGPDRFKDIETVTRDACQKFIPISNTKDVISRIMILDDQIQLLRSQHSSLTTTANNSLSSSQQDLTSSQKEKDTYQRLLVPSPDLRKAEKLLQARMKSVQALQRLLATKKLGVKET